MRKIALTLVLAMFGCDQTSISTEKRSKAVDKATASFESCVDYFQSAEKSDIAVASLGQVGCVWFFARRQEKISPNGTFSYDLHRSFLPSVPLTTSDEVSKIFGHCIVDKLLKQQLANLIYVTECAHKSGFKNPASIDNLFTDQYIKVYEQLERSAANIERARTVFNKPQAPPERIEHFDLWIDGKLRLCDRIGNSIDCF